MNLYNHKNLKKLADYLQILIKSRLWLQILFGMALGATSLLKLASGKTLKAGLTEYGKKGRALRSGVIENG